ncbi:SsgA family sporulation/cell division regulator [Streptomyces sp. NPDC006610]|jgi:hypothetical protein|uniref:SsgA family sporulation/cell division regulator n=1 Tax=Streptomyces sp. NPDC006610 TaxID=3154584 RepID=UPI0033AF7D4D
MTLEQYVLACLITALDEELPVPATLRYTCADPLAVHIDFPAEVCLGGAGVTWTFARSLLEDGLSGPAGAGDVHVWPCGSDRTVIEFHSGHGLALLQFDTGALRGFVRASHAVVEPGREDVGEAVDRGLISLFGAV